MSKEYLLQLLQKIPIRSNVHTVLNTKPNPFLEFDRDSLTATYVGKNLVYSDTTSIQSNRPANRDHLIYYYEITIKDLAKSDISVGFADSGFPMNKHPGHTKNSYGYQNDGQVYSSKKLQKKLQKMKDLDVIGCGINYLKKEIFFTYNGIYNGPIFFDIDSNSEYYPTLGMHGPRQKIKFNFGQEKFKFNLEGHIQEEKEGILSVILGQEVHHYDIHKLVQSYLYFNGYFSTLNAFEDASKMSRDSTHLILKDNLQGINPLQITRQHGVIDCKQESDQLNNILNQNSEYHHASYDKQSGEDKMIGEDENSMSFAQDSNYQCHSFQTSLMNDNSTSFQMMLNNNSLGQQQVSTQDNSQIERLNVEEEEQDEEQKNTNGFNQLENTKSIPQNGSRYHNNGGDQNNTFKRDASHNENTFNRRNETIQDEINSLNSSEVNSNGNNSSKERINPSETQLQTTQSHTLNNNNNSHTNGNGNNNNHTNFSQNIIHDHNNHNTQNNHTNNNNTSYTSNGNNNNNNNNNINNGNNHNNNNNIHNNNQNNNHNNNHNNNINNHNNESQNGSKQSNKNRNNNNNNSIQIQNKQNQMQIEIDSPLLQKSKMFEKQGENEYQKEKRETSKDGYLSSSGLIGDEAIINRTGFNSTELLQNKLESNKDILEHFRSDILMMISNGQSEQCIKKIQNELPQLLIASKEVLPNLYAQAFIERIKTGQVLEAVIFAQLNLSNFQNEIFYSFNDNGFVVPISINELMGLSAISDYSKYTGLQFLLSQNQRYIIQDLINKSILDLFGCADASILEVLLKQLQQIANCFKQDKYYIGEIYQLKV